MRFVKVLVVILVIAVLWLAGIQFYFSNVEPTRYNARVADAVRDAIGRELSTVGSTELDIFPFPTIVVQDVRLANASWGSRADMVRVPRLEAELSLIPLLFGRIEFRRLVLEKPDVLFETDASGHGNWEFDAPATSQPGAPKEDSASSAKHVVFSSIVLHGGVIRFHDGASGKRLSATIDELALRENLIGDRLQISLAGSIADRPLKLGGSIGRVLAFLRNEPWHLDLKLEALGAEVTSTGLLEKPLELEGVKLAVSLTAASLKEIDEALGISLPPVNDVEASASLARLDGRWRLAELKARFLAAGAETRVAGDVGDLRNLRQVNLGIEIEDMSADALAQLTGLDSDRLTPIETLDARATLHDAGELYRLDALKVEAQVADGTAHVSGSVGDLWGAQNIDLDVELDGVHGSSIATMFQVSHEWLRSLRNIEAGARLRGNDGVYRLDGLRGTGRVDNGVVRADGTVPDLLDGSGLDLRLNLNAVPARSLARVAGLQHESIESVRNLEVTVRLREADGVYRLEELDATAEVGQGRARVNGEVEGLRGEPNLNLAVELDGISARDVAHLIGEDLEDLIKLDEVEDLHASFQLAKAGDLYRLDDLTASARIAGSDARVQGSVTDLLDARHFTLDFDLQSDHPDRLAQLADVKLPPLDRLEATGTLSDKRDVVGVDDLSVLAFTDGASMKVTGSVHDVSNPRNLRLEVQVQAESLASLSRIVDVELPDVGPVQGSATFSGDRQAFHLDELRARVGDSDLSGALAIEQKGGRFAINGSVAATNLDLNELLPKTAKDDTGRDEDSEQLRVFSADPIPLTPIRALDAKLRLRAERLTIADVVIENADLNIKQKAGRLRLEFGADAFGGRATGVLSVDAGVEPVAWMVELDGNQYLLEESNRQIRHIADVEGGRTDLELRLRAHGNSWREIMAGLDGRVYMVSEGVTVRNAGLSRIGDGLFTIIVRLATPEEDKQGKTIVECAVLGFDINDGIASADRTIALETTKVSMAANGQINLKDESLDMGAAFTSRNVLKLRSGSLWKAVKVRGTLAQPKLNVDATGAAKTAATVAGAVFTMGLSLIAQETTLRLMQDSNPCGTASNRMLAARIDDVSPAGSRAKEE
jgi:uncharacterized protein involved in outer membrane biogenesis